MKIILKYISLIAIMITFFCGMYRHDVDKQKYLDLAKQPQFNCVGRLYLNAKLLCTGELIDKRYFITAAHAFKKNYTPEKSDENNNSEISGSGKYTVDFKGIKYNVKKIFIYPGYLYNATEQDFDIALIELSEEVQGITPATIYIGSDELHAVVTCVGYGGSGAPTQLDSLNKDEKIAGENVIDSIWGITIKGHPSKLTFDFDSPDDASLNAMGSPMPLPLEYFPNGGDSGGGMFINQNGKWLLVGITSIGHATIRIKSGYYGSTADYTRISVYADWIRSNIQ